MRRGLGCLRRRASSAALFLALGTVACASNPARSERSGRAELVRAIDRALADPALARSGAAILVVSLDRGDTLYARQHDRLYTPASNLKLFTAAAALHLLGQDYRFVTPLLATGSFDGDTLRGDLVLVGRGDPDLVTSDLAALVDTLATIGVRVVAGDVRADASWFDNVEWGSGWMWDDGPYRYWPYVSALTLNDNSVTLIARPGREPGAPVRTVLAPATGYVEVNVRATTATAETEPALVVDRHWAPVKENVIDVSGTLPLGSDSTVAIRTVEVPALYAATVLAELLEARGISILGEPVVEPLAAGEAPVDTIARHVSDRLANSVRNFLKESDNLTGEQLVKTIAAETSGPPGSYAAGLAAERAFLAGEVGIDTTALRLADGSGVSRYNLVTARQIVRLLEFMSGRPDLREAWIDALPVAAIDGTLEERLAGTRAAGRARAKTGSLSGVSALSGYVPSATDESLAFSLIMEFFVGPTGPSRAAQDSIVAALARFAR